MTHRVGRKGQVVIPKPFRDAIRLEAGDEVTFSQDGNTIRIARVASPDALMGRLSGRRLVAALPRSHLHAARRVSDQTAYRSDDSLRSHAHDG
jgi:AbrB family looped-hinge helix DNA binding protein